MPGMLGCLRANQTEVTSVVTKKDMSKQHEARARRGCFFGTMDRPCFALASLARFFLGDYLDILKSKQQQARARYARTRLLILNYESRSLPSRDPFLVIILTYRQ